MKKLSIEKKDIIYTIKNALLVIIGSVVLAFGFGVFLMPFDLVTGGVSGLSLVLSVIIPIEFLTVDIYVTVFTWLLFFIGLIFLGKQFALKTIISSIVYPPALSLFMRLPSKDVFDGFFMIGEKYGDSVAVSIIAAVFGGVLVGVGCALTFRGGGSTGGLDILALIVAKYTKKLKSSVLIFVFDAIVVVLGVFVFKDIVMCLLGVTSAFVVALVIDKIFLGASKAFIAHIVSDKYEEINYAIIHKLERTSTIMDAVGGYSGCDKKMIMVSFTMPQYAAFMNIINGIDREAFVTIHRAHEIDGEGWTKYDVKPRR